MQSNPDVEGPQAAEHTLHEEELENVSKVKDPNGGRVSGSHVISFSHDLPPLLNHFLHQFQCSYFKGYLNFHMLARCWEATCNLKQGFQITS